MSNYINSYHTKWYFPILYDLPLTSVSSVTMKLKTNTTNLIATMSNYSIIKLFNCRLKLLHLDYSIRYVKFFLFKYAKHEFASLKTKLPRENSIWNVR